MSRPPARPNRSPGSTHPSPTRPELRRLARRLAPPARPHPQASLTLASDAAPRRPAEPTRRRTTGGPRPTLGPRGPVQWWTRPAPGGDEALWRAVVHLHTVVQDRRVPLSLLARCMQAEGTPISREALSRILNGASRTSWRTVEAIARCLDVDAPLPDEPER